MDWQAGSQPACIKIPNREYMRGFRLVKRITMTLDDDEFERWKALKGSKSWHDFFKSLVELSEEAECVSKESLCDYVKKQCELLVELAKMGCLGREEALLRLCAGGDDAKDLLRAFIVVTNALVSKLTGVNKWIALLARALILDVVQGNTEGIRRGLEELCSISTPSQ